MRYDDAAAFRAALAANLRTQHPDKDLSRLLKRTMMERFLARTATALPDQAILKDGDRPARPGNPQGRLRTRATPAAGPHHPRPRPVDPGPARQRGGGGSARRCRDRPGRPPVVQGRDDRRQDAPGRTHGRRTPNRVPPPGRETLPALPLDVGLGAAVPDRTDLLRGGIDLSFAGLPALETPALPLEVHLAEKLHALSLPRPEGRLNTRVMDLVDVILLQRRGLRPMNAPRAAAEATFARRATHALPDMINLPTDAWEVEYQRFAAALGLTSYAPTAHDAAMSLNRPVKALREDEA